MVFDGILFDLDGTLWDACRAVAESWTLTLKTRYGIERGVSTEESRSIMGMTEKGVAEHIFARYGDDADGMCHRCLMDEGEYITRHGADIYAGLEAALEKLSASARLFIVSNCQCGYIEAFLSCSGLGRFFTAFECEGSTGLTKGENIRLLVERFGLKTPVYVGDTAMDEAAAKEAGCPFIHAAYGFGSAAAPVGVINSPRELPALLERL